MFVFFIVDRDLFEVIELWKKKVFIEGYFCFLCVCFFELCYNEYLFLYVFKWKCFVNRNLKLGV